MKIFKKRNRGPILSKFDIFTGKVQEFWEPVEGKEHATQGYIRGVLEGSTSPLQLTKYHLIKKFRNRKKENKNITTHNIQKTTKHLRKLTQIYYFTVLAKKLFYLTATLKKIKKHIKIWSKQLIQNEIYYLKKALSLAKTKEQIAYVYLKFKKSIKLYKKLHFKYLKATYIQYLRILKKHKRSWSKMLVHGFTNRKYYKRRARILPFIMFLKKRLFRKMRTGTHRNMRYWKKLIRKFAAKYNILQEQDVSAVVSDRLPIYNDNIKTEGLNIDVDTTIKQYLLLKYVVALRTKSRTEVFNKVRHVYYNLLLNNKLRNENVNKTNINIKTLKMIAAKKKWKKIKIQKLNKLSRFCALANKKRFYIFNNGYIKRRRANYIARLIERQLKQHHLNAYRDDIISKLMLTGKLSMWFILFKNWNKMAYIKLLKKAMKNANITRKISMLRAKNKSKFAKKKLTKSKQRNRRRMRAFNKIKKNKAVRNKRIQLKKLIRKLCKLLPLALQNKIRRSLLKKILNLKRKLKKKLRKRKLIRMLRLKKKGQLRRKKRKYKLKLKTKKFKSKRRKYKKTKLKQHLKHKKYKKYRRRSGKYKGRRRIIKKTKKAKRRTRARIKRRIKRFLRRGGKKYKNTAFLIQDYSCYWIDNLKKKTKFKKRKGKRSILKISKKVRTWKMRRYLRKNYRYMLNPRFNIIIRHKEIANKTVNMFTP